MMQIDNVRNSYRLRTALLYLLRHARTEREIDLIKNKDIENYYNEHGVQTLPPYEMCERMHLVVRSILNKGNVH